MMALTNLSSTPSSSGSASSPEDSSSLSLTSPVSMPLHWEASIASNRA
jgi:hypothetical protein